MYATVLASRGTTTQSRAFTRRLVTFTASSKVMKDVCLAHSGAT